MFTVTRTPAGRNAGRGVVVSTSFQWIQEFADEVVYIFLFSDGPYLRDDFEGRRGNLAHIGLS